MSFNVTILGSNSAFPTIDRFSTAHVINLHERFFLIDCGEGTQIQLRRYKIRFAKINHIFISHLHGDHIYGLPGLLSTFTLIGREHPLNIYCHPRLKNLIEAQKTLIEEYVSYKIEFHYLEYDKPKLLFEDDKVIVKSFPLKHRIPTCGFIFTEKPKLPNIKKQAIEKYNLSIQEIVKIKNGSDLKTHYGKIIPNRELVIKAPPCKSYAFCSDTAYDTDIIPVIKNTSLLYHEATFTNEHSDKASSRFHSTAEEAAKIAKLANAEKLIIGHFSARYKSTNSLLSEAKEVFSNTIAAEDGLKVEIL